LPDVEEGAEAFDFGFEAEDTFGLGISGGGVEFVDVDAIGVGGRYGDGLAGLGIGVEEAEDLIIQILTELFNHVYFDFVAGEAGDGDFAIEAQGDGSIGLDLTWAGDGAAWEGFEDFDLEGVSREDLAGFTEGGEAGFFVEIGLFAAEGEAEVLNFGVEFHDVSEGFLLLFLKAAELFLEDLELFLGSILGGFEGFIELSDAEGAGGEALFFIFECELGEIEAGLRLRELGGGGFDFAGIDGGEHGSGGSCGRGSGFVDGSGFGLRVVWFGGDLLGDEGPADECVCELDADTCGAGLARGVEDDDDAVGIAADDSGEGLVFGGRGQVEEGDAVVLIGWEFVVEMELSEGIFGGMFLIGGVEGDQAIFDDCGAEGVWAFEEFDHEALGGPLGSCVEFRKGVVAIERGGGVGVSGMFALGDPRGVEGIGWWCNGVVTALYDCEGEEAAQDEGEGAGGGEREALVPEHGGEDSWEEVSGWRRDEGVEMGRERLDEADGACDGRGGEGNFRGPGTSLECSGEGDGSGGRVRTLRLEAFLECGTGAGEAALDGTDGPIEGAGGFRMGVALEVAEDDGSAVFGRESIEFGIEIEEEGWLFE
jgi:hypothetical protein